jgi:tetratricopeptide (TPR) repeat protein
MLLNLWRELRAQRTRKRQTSTAAPATAIEVAQWQARRQQAAAGDGPGGRIPLARELHDLLLATQQHHADAGLPHPVELLSGWRLLGDWCWQDKRHDAAEAAYRQALRCNPMDGRTQEGLGLTLLHLQRPEQAGLHFELAHRVDPMNSEVLTHWGLVDLELGNLAAAAERFQKAIERQPRNPHAWHNLGLAMLRMGHLDGAIGQFEHALELAPAHGLAWSNLALARRQAEDLAGARSAAQRACELKGHNNARVWTVLADIEADAGDFDAALGHVAQSRALDPDYLGAHVAQGKLCAALGRLDEARVAYEQALVCSPQHADARGGLGQLLLLQAQWEQAWPLYEARRETRDNPVRRLPILPWQGEDLQDRQVLVHAEQGLGDIIMFCACLGDLITTGAQITVEVPPRLTSLFVRSFPQVTVLSHEPRDPGLAWLGTPTQFEREVAMGSLPLHFRRSAGSFGPGAAYLKADPLQVEDWRQRLLDSRARPSRPDPTAAAPAHHPFVLGLCWRGGLLFTGACQRSIELQSLLAGVLANSAHAARLELLCLQHGEVDDEIAQAQITLGRTIHRGPRPGADLDDFAAATQACDAVLTVCSTQAHLTGALGVPGLVLVPANPNWRYGHSGRRIPWYGSLELAREPQRGQRAALLEQIGPWLDSRIAMATAAASA